MFVQYHDNVRDLNYITGKDKKHHAQYLKTCFSNGQNKCRDFSVCVFFYFLHISKMGALFGSEDAVSVLTN